MTHEEEKAAWEQAVLEEYDTYFLWFLAHRPQEVCMSFARFRAFHIIQKIDPRTMSNRSK